MVRSLNDEEYNRLFGEHIITLMEFWNIMQEEEQVERVSKCYFDFLPSEYNIIIDDEVLILGNYIFTEKDRTHVTVGKVFTVENSRREGKNIINTYINRFDLSFDYFQKNGGDKIRR